MKLTVTTVFLFMFLSVFSQGGKECSGVTYIQEENSINNTTLISAQKIDKVKDVEYNFQFILQNNIKPLLTEEILVFVEENRALDSDVTIDYSDKVKLFIPSIKSIQSPSYLELPLYK